MVDLPEIVVTPDDTGPGTGAANPPAENPESPTAPLSTVTVPPNTSRFPDSEIATLMVRSAVFSDWESIWLQYRWNDAFAYFRFIAAERPPPSDWTLLQFKPGDPCTVTLAQQPALTGLITDRQASYDANRHQVQLIGKSNTHWGYKSSVDLPTGSFDGQNLEQIYQSTMGKYPGTPKVIGVVNPLPFEKVSNEVGETNWDFNERLARVRGAVLGADNFGNYLLIGQHSFPVTATLQEGVNIQACECHISRDDFYSLYDARGHTAGTDDKYGSQANEVKAVVPGHAPVESHLIIPIEQVLSNATAQAEAADRAYNEAKWREGTEVIANIVVYGWTWNGVDLWACGQNVTVVSPMAMLNMVMKIRTVTFEQNNSAGTTSTLELVAPWVLNDGAELNPGNPGAPQAPTPGPDSTPTPGGIGHA